MQIEHTGQDPLIKRELNPICCDTPPSGYIALDPEKYPAINNRGNLTTKQLALLAAAEESYSQAAGMLWPILQGLAYGDLTPMKCDKARLRTAFHMLEEAMSAHNRYMESLE